MTAIEWMKKLAHGDAVIVHDRNTFEPFIRYENVFHPMPDEVDDYLFMIRYPRF